MNSILFWNELSLVMKNGLFTITSLEKDHGPSVMNHIESLIASKNDYAVWWDWKGVVFFKLLPRNQTINWDAHCRQLNNLNAVVKEKRPELVNRKGVIFHDDNATLHTSLATRQKLLRLGWEVMLHPPYSPDLPPSDYYLFRYLQNSLNGKAFNDDETMKLLLAQFFVDKEQKFYERGITKLPERWQKVIEQNRKYIID